MSVYLRGKYYTYDFMFSGERYKGSTKQTEKREALKFETQVKEQAKKGLIGEGKSILLSNAFDAFLRIPR